MALTRYKLKMAGVGRSPLTVFDESRWTISDGPSGLDWIRSKVHGKQSGERCPSDCKKLG